MEGQPLPHHRRLTRATLTTLALVLLAGLLFTAQAVLAQPPGAAPQDAPWATAVKVNTGPTGGGRWSTPRNALAVAPSGSNVYAVWTGVNSGLGNDVMFAASLNGGVAWGSSITVSAGALATSGDGPVIAAAGSTTVHVAWPRTEASGNSAVRYSKSSVSGASWGVSQTLKSAILPGSLGAVDIAASRGKAFVAWKESEGIRLVTSPDDGATWGTPVLAFGLVSATLYGNVSIAADAVPSVYVAWDEGYYVADRYACYGMLLNGTNRQNQSCPVHLTSGIMATDPDIALDPSAAGRVYMLYVDDSAGIPAIWHIASDDNGATWRAPVRVSDPAYTATEPSMVATAADILYATWTDSRDGDDIFYAKSEDGGASWSPSSRVNPASSSAQRSSALAARADGPRALWASAGVDTWDIMASHIITNCPAPLSALSLDGPDADPGVTTVYTASITPTGATGPIDYTWTAAGLVSGQGTANAAYNWPVPGTYPITVTASNCGGTLAAGRTVVVSCTAGLSYVHIEGAKFPVTAGDVVILTALPYPVDPNPVVTYIWAPQPLTGQGTTVATYRWQIVGGHPVTLTAENCGGRVGAYATVTVTDNVAPAWGPLSPAGWITTTQSPTLIIRVSDGQSGLDASTGFYDYTRDAGASWSGWTAAPVSGADYTTTSQTLTAASVPFETDSSLAGGQTRIRFRVADMAGNLGQSSEYTVTIDTRPPANPSSITGDRPTSVWANDFTAVMTWTAATDSGSGVAGYSYLWSQDALDLPPEVISTTSLSAATLIPAYGQHWYFHVRAVDNVGRWSPASAHQGPYWVGNAPPAFLMLSPQSSGQGGEVVLTGFGWDSQVTVTVLFTSTSPGGSGEVRETLGQFETSWDGTFQAMAAVPLGAFVGAGHGFVVTQTGKTARAAFTVQPGMVIDLVTPLVQPKQNVSANLSSLNPNGSIVVETDGAYNGPHPLQGQTSFYDGVQVPADAISGTHMLTVTNRINGYVVQKRAVPFSVFIPPPVVPLTQANAEIHVVSPPSLHGVRGQTISATGLNPRACEEVLGFPGETWDGECRQVDFLMGLQKPSITWPVTWCLTTAGILPDVKSNVTMAANGQFNGQIKLRDVITNTIQNEPWGTYNLCHYTDFIQHFHATEPPVCGFGSSGTQEACEPVTQATQAAPAAQLVPMWAQPTPVPQIPGAGVDPGNAGGQPDWTIKNERSVTCTTFTVDEPPHYIASYRLLSGTQVIPVEYSPQMVWRGQATGWLTGTHPLKIRDVFTADPAEGMVMRVNEPEGNYKYDAFACHFLPKADQPAHNYGRGGTTWPTQDVQMQWIEWLGPSPRGVSTTFDTALTQQGKIGPFLSFADSIHGQPAVEVPFVMWFDDDLEEVQAVTVTLPTGAIQLATYLGKEPGDATHSQWGVTLNVSMFPAGQVTTTVQAYGRYKVDGCKQSQMFPGAPWPIPVVVMPAPGWLNHPLAAPVVQYDPVKKAYHMSGTVGQGVPGKSNWTVIPGGVDLNYLGLIDNEITAQVDVAEDFSIYEGKWQATVGRIHGKSNIFCLPGDPDCKQNYDQPLAMNPPGGVIQKAGEASMPATYAYSGKLSNNDYGPWQVYNGIIASYWGIVNVNLSISFGANSQAILQANLVQDLTPNMKIVPQATLIGFINLWVDVLAGVAAAGVEGQPFLTLAMPVDIVGDTVTKGGPDICFGLKGRVWAEMLFWGASFGPFEIFKTGTCYGLASAMASGDMALAAATPPPSVLPAPSLAADGYGHLLGTWLHNNANDPDQRQGVLYYVYWDGATWSGGAPAITSTVSGANTYLISDPEVAFAGMGKAVAVFASNDVNTTKPVTWTQVQSQGANQEIAYSVFNGVTWTPKANLTNSQGPSGRATLAGDPFHDTAMAAWVHDTSAQAGFKQWVIEYSVFDAAANGGLGSWIAPSNVITPFQGQVVAEPHLAFNSLGEAALAFVNQAGVVEGSLETPFNKNDQRSMNVWKWTPSSKSWLSVTGIFPKGVLYPSVAWDMNDRLMVAYTVYDKDRGGGPTGFGNNNLLGYGVLSNTKWLTQTHAQVRGVERPRMVPLKQDLAVILFRGFGEVNTPEFSGVPMAVTVNPNKAAKGLPNIGGMSNPGKLTNIAGWQYAAASSGGAGVKGSLITMGVHNLPTLAPAAASSSQVQANLPGASLRPASIGPMAGPADQVILMNVPVQPDLSIKAGDLNVSDPVPLPGSTVAYTATVRNLGLAATTQPVEIRVYLDEEWTGEALLQSQWAPVEMAFMDVYTVTGQWIAQPGVHKLTVSVHPVVSEDVDGANNRVTYFMGSPEPPEHLTAVGNAGGPVVGLTWLPSAGTAITGYVVYRAELTETVKYLAFTPSPAYLDTTVARGGRYRYAVASLTGAGIQSVLSAEVVADVPGKVYLPVVTRQAM